MKNITIVTVIIIAIVVIIAAIIVAVRKQMESNYTVYSGDFSKTATKLIDKLSNSLAKFEFDTYDGGGICFLIVGYRLEPRLHQPNSPNIWREVKVKVIDSPLWEDGAGAYWNSAEWMNFFRRKLPTKENTVTDVGRVHIAITGKPIESLELKSLNLTWRSGRFVEVSGFDGTNFLTFTDKKIKQIDSVSGVLDFIRDAKRNGSRVIAV